MFDSTTMRERMDPRRAPACVEHAISRLLLAACSGSDSSDVTHMELENEKPHRIEYITKSMGKNQCWFCKKNGSRGTNAAISSVLENVMWPQYCHPRRLDFHTVGIKLPIMQLTAGMFARRDRRA